MDKKSLQALAQAKADLDREAQAKASYEAYKAEQSATPSQQELDSCWADREERTSSKKGTLTAAQLLDLYDHVA